MPEKMFHGERKTMVRIIVNNTPFSFSPNKIRGIVHCGVIRGVIAAENIRFPGKIKKNFSGRFPVKNFAAIGRALDGGRGAPRGSARGGIRIKCI
jgi:hypothetical protein